MNVRSRAKLILESKLLLRRLWQNGLVIGFICLFAFVTNKWIEAFIFCVSHVEIRRKFDKQYHTIMSYCIPITISVAFFGITVSPGVNVSILTTVLLAYGICYVGYALQDRLDLIAEKVKAALPFNCKTATESEIQDRARQRGVSNEQAQWVIDKYIKGITFSQLCRQGESEKACQVRIKRIVDKINAPV